MSESDLDNMTNDTKNKLKLIANYVKSNNHTEFNNLYQSLNIKYINEATAILSIIHNNLNIFQELESYGMNFREYADVYILFCVLFSRDNFVKYMINNGLDVNSNYLYKLADISNNYKIIEKFIDMGISIHPVITCYTKNEMIGALRDHNVLSYDTINKLIMNGFCCRGREHVYNWLTEAELTEYCSIGNNSTYIVIMACMNGDIKTINKLLHLGIDIEDVNKKFGSYSKDTNNLESIDCLKKLQLNGLVINDFIANYVLFGYNDYNIIIGIVQWLYNTTNIRHFTINKFWRILSLPEIDSDDIDLIQNFFNLNTNEFMPMTDDITHHAIKYLFENGYDFNLNGLNIFSIPNMYEWLDKININYIDDDDIDMSLRSIELLLEYIEQNPNIKKYISYVTIYQQMCYLFFVSSTVDGAKYILSMIDNVDTLYNIDTFTKISVANRFINCRHGLISFECMPNIDKSTAYNLLSEFIVKFNLDEKWKTIIKIYTDDVSQVIDEDFDFFSEYMIDRYLNLSNYDSEVVIKYYHKLGELNHKLSMDHILDIWYAMPNNYNITPDIINALLSKLNLTKLTSVAGDMLVNVFVNTNELTANIFDCIYENLEHINLGQLIKYLLAYNGLNTTFSDPGDESGDEWCDNQYYSDNSCTDSFNDDDEHQI